MHRMLLDCATQQEGEGDPVEVVVNHKVCGLHSNYMESED